MPQPWERPAAATAAPATKDPWEQPGPQAIGDNGSPTWVDQVKSLPEKIQNGIYNSGFGHHSAIMNALTNPAVQGPLKKLAGLIPQAGDIAVKMGQPNPGVPIPFTDGKNSINLSDIENVGGNLLLGKLASLAAEKAGGSLYASGNKNLDIVGKRYGKEPVSDVLKKYGIRGSEETRVEAMNNLAKDLQSKNAAIEEAGTAAGAKPNMVEAVAPAQKVIDENIETANPRQPETVVPQLQGELEKIKATNAQAPKPTFEGMTPETSGPTLKQVRQWKSAASAKTDYDQGVPNDLRDKFEKAIANGHKVAVEKAIDGVLGPEESQTYKQNNDELGRLLTSKERALRDAEIEARKPHGFSEVDALAMAAEPKYYVLKQLARLAKTADVRTSAGYNMEAMAPDIGAATTGLGMLPKQQNNKNPWSK